MPRNQRLITGDGVTLNVTQWAARLGITRAALYARLNQATEQEALRGPPGKRRRVAPNEKFWNLTVKAPSPTKKRECGGKRPKWVCECKCGRVVEVLTKNLASGNTKSCGCRTGSRKPKSAGEA